MHTLKHEGGCSHSYKIVIFAINTTNCITLHCIHQYMATCFDQLHGHPQAIQTHKIKITIGNFILSTINITPTEVTG